MSPELLFYELVDLPEQERRSYYQTHETAEEIRAEVESLIAEDRKAKSALEAPVIDAARLALAGIEAQRAPFSCGPYKLRESIGAGGMGTVYRAERVDGEVRSQVAIKLIRVLGRDAATRERFLRERQILASLSHPNIAHLLDAGHSTDEQDEPCPYLVMEFVEGVAIDRWAADRPLREVLQTFLQVCDAVAYAHRQLFIHRDLKPDNILVTAEGVPKLLDFGIAAEIARGESLTRSVVYTPDFASPEQARGAQLSTATDIYSLGAVLYKILTGRSPNQFDGPTPEGFQTALTERATVPPSQFCKACRGDLDAILLRALRKEPAARYSSVEQFADDLRAYLESRPVRARHGEALYLTRKLLRRYWIPAVAFAAVLATMGVGLVINQRERRVAERRFADVRGLAGTLLDVEAQIRNMPRSLAVRQSIVGSVVGTLDRLSAEVRDDIGLRVEVASAYRRVAQVQAQRTQSSFGLHSEALNSLKKAEALLKQVRAADPRHAAAADEWFYVQSDMADRLFDLRDEASDRVAQRTADQLAQYLNSVPPSDAHELVALRVYYAAARSLINSGKTADSLRYSELGSKVSLARAARLRTPESQINAASSFRMHATAQRYAGDLQGALDSVARAESLLPSDPENRKAQRERFEIEYCRGVTLGEANGVSLERFPEATDALAKAVAMLHVMIAEDPSDAEPRVNLAQTALKLGQIQWRQASQMAKSTFEDGLRELSAAPETNHYVPDYRARLKAELSIVLKAGGKSEESRARLEDATAAARKLTKEWPPKAMGPSSLNETIFRAQAELAAAEGRYRDAAAIYEDALKRILANPSLNVKGDLDDACRVSAKLSRLAELLAKAGEESGADKYRQQRTAIWRQWASVLPGSPLVLNQLKK